MEPTFNITPATPDDMTAFGPEYDEWLDAVEAACTDEQSEPVERDLCDIVREHDESCDNEESTLEADDLQEWRNPDENDVPLDGDAESALASAGFGTDEDYEHNDAWMDEDYNGMYEGEY